MAFLNPIPRKFKYLLWREYGHFLELYIVIININYINNNSYNVVVGDNDSDSHRRKRKKTKKHHKLVYIPFNNKTKSYLINNLLTLNVGSVLTL